MIPTLTAFERSPDCGRGLARDMRVRWALEEVGQPYQVRLLSFEALKQDEYLALQPFGQIPIYQEGAQTLFETGAIVLHLAGHHPGLLPVDPGAKARAISWMLAALNTVEPVVLEREMAVLTEQQQPWYAQRLPVLEHRIHQRLAALSRHLGDAPWLDGAFSAGDLLMVMVLLRLESSGLLARYPNLEAYLARGKARPAFQRAFEAQRQVYLAAQAAD